MAPRWTVYCHTHIASGRRYVGLTKKTMMARWNQHVYNSKKRTGRECVYFWAAIRKYGKDAFSHEVLGTYDTLEAANAAEVDHINKLNTRDRERGFNLTRGGFYPIVDKVSYSELQSALASERWKNPDYRSSVVSSMRVTKNLPENRKKASARSKALWDDPSFRVKVTESSVSSLEAKVRGIEAMKAAFSTPGSIEKRSSSSKKMWEERREALLVRHHDLRKDLAYVARAHSGLVSGASRNRNKTHCLRGHEFTPENIYTDRRGSRNCKACWKSRKTVAP